MRYEQSKERSNELLRQALPLVARHGSGCHPPSYALWYEYADGSNAELRAVLDGLIARREPLTADETHEIYRRFIANREVAATDELQSQLQKTLDAMSRAASEAGSDAERYGASLNKGGKQLDAPLDLNAARQVIAALAVETQRMEASNAKLTQELNASRRELLEISTSLATVRSEAMVDPLTGLANRRGFHKAIDDGLANGASGLAGWSLLMLDIDHFKKVNDTHGHVLGDKVLQAVAAVMRSAVNPHHIVTRFGGEEFAILVQDATEAEALALAERIRQSVARGRIRRADQGEPIGGITISIGLARFRSGESLERWIERADAALYRSKQSGRNRVTVDPPHAAR